VPWRAAFDTLLDVNGLAMEQRGNVIWVALLSELAARERLRFDAHARAADLEPLASRTFELHYAHAEELRKLLTASGNQRVLSKRGAAMADPRTNLLFVTDLEARLEQIDDLIGSLDRPTRQVLIEARIVEAEKGFMRNLGVKLSSASTSQDGTVTGVVGGKDGSVFDLSARPISGFDAATAGLTLFAAQATRLVNIELSALESERRGQIVSSPRVVTADRMKAIVEQGTELPYQAKVGQGVSGVQFRRATLKLEVEPQITPDGRVVLDLDVAKDSVSEQTASGPAINTKHVQTRVEVEDGGTVSIAGIYEADDREDVTRVPLLGKIPLLGRCFGTARTAIRQANSPFSSRRGLCRQIDELPAKRHGRGPKARPVATAPAVRLDKAGALPVSCRTNYTGLARGQVASAGRTRQRIFCRAHGGRQDHRGPGRGAPAGSPVLRLRP
jgi:type IV pilus assembly protein PilQ